MALMDAITGGASIAITIKAIDEFSNILSNATTGFNKLGTIMGGLAIGALAATTTAMINVGVASVKLAGDFEQTQVAFTTMLGSAEEAQSMLSDLADFAKKTPFTIQGVEKSATQLMAVGFSAEDIIPTLKSVGDIAAGLGLGEEGLQRLILNLGQVQSQGKLTGRELRDFAIAGVPLLAELSKQLGVTEADVTDMISKGEISTEMVTKAFESMSSGGGRFADLMGKQALTFEGMMSNMKDTLALMGRDIGTALLPPLKELLDVFANQILPAIQPLIPVFIEFVTTILEGLIPYLPQLSEMFMRLVNVTMQLFTALSPLIEPLMNLAFVIFDALMAIIEPLIPTIKILAEALAPLFTALGQIISMLTPLIKLVVQIAALFINLAINNIMAILGPALEFLMPIIQKIIDFFTEVVDVVKTVVEWITNLIGVVRDFLSSGIEKIGEVASSLASRGSYSNRTKSVGDAIIAPGGKVITTNPNDYLIATQNPESLMSQGNGVTYVIEITGNNIYGTDADDIAEALQDILTKKLSLGN